MGRAHPFALAAMVGAVVLAAPAAWPEPVMACAAAPVRVSAPEARDGELACVAAARAVARLQSFGLMIRDPVLIEVTEEMDVAPGVCVALYSSGTGTLQVLPVDCLDDRDGRASAFPEMEAGVLFESLVLHELVHASLDQTPAASALPRLAHEYLAYAIQLAALPADDLARVLERARVAKPVALPELNEAVLDFSPLRFAAMAYLHFMQEGGDAAAVARVVSGAVVFFSLRE